MKNIKNAWLDNNGNDMAAILFLNGERVLDSRVFNQYLPRGARPVGIISQTSIHCFAGWTPTTQDIEKLKSIAKEMQMFYGNPSQREDDPDVINFINFMGKY
jgi:hypothetical protein